MHETKRPLKVFLCHASVDKPKVRELYRYLRRRGVNPWFDEEHIIGGQDWQVEIPKALATSDAIIICLTKNSVDKEGYIQKEIKFALDKALEMPEGRIFLIPVKFEECEVPYTLSRYQWVDLTIESGYSKMMKALKFRASQLERSTVEISKKTVEEEKLAIEKAAREKAEREAAERAVREKAEEEAIEKARLEAEELARQKAAKEKADRESAERLAQEKVELESAERLAKSPPNRILEAAIQKQVIVNKPVSLYVWIKQIDSKSIISIVKSDVDENAVLDENNVKSKGLEIEFPVENGVVGKARVSLRLVAPEFSPPMQQKEIKVPVSGDSDVCTFLVTPKKAGELLLNIEVLKGEFSVVNRNLWTTAIETVAKETSPMVLVSIPIFVVVQPKFDVININGNVSDSLIISGDDNAINVEKVRLEAEELARQKTAKEKVDRESAERLAQEKIEKEFQHEREKIIKDSRRKLKWENFKINVRYSFAPIFMLLFVIGALTFLIFKYAPILTLALNSTPQPSQISTKDFIPTKTFILIPTNKTPTLIFTPAELATVTPKSLPTEITDEKGVAMALVPAGEFILGSNSGSDNQKPSQNLFLNSFYIDKYEVTNTLYANCVKENKCLPPTTTYMVMSIIEKYSYYGEKKYDNYPVIFVDWNMAKDYCEWRGTRLPTEAEWEKSARGTNGNTYPWGENLECSLANYGGGCNKDFSRQTSPVSAYSSDKSIFGVYNLAGNVKEWVNSLYKPYPYNEGDGRENVNALGTRVIRGGSWEPDDYDPRSTYRSGYANSTISRNIGFRCAKSAP